MADYQRFVSYIYSYPGGVKDKNVGFAKVEVRAGEMRLNINLRGVYTDTPQMFGVHMLIDRDASIPGRYRLMKVGDCIVNNGMASYAGIFNASNIDNTGYASSDICGIAVANKGDRYYMMFSMWEDYDVNPDVIEFAGSDVRKYRISDTKENVKKASEENAGCVSEEGIDTAYKDTESKYSESQNGRIKAAAYKDEKNRHNEAVADVNVRESMEKMETYLKFTEKIGDFISGKVFELEEELEKKEIMGIMKQIINNYDKCVLVVDSEGKILDANDLALKELKIESGLGLAYQRINIIPKNEALFGKDIFSAEINREKYNLIGTLIPVTGFSSKEYKIFLFENFNFDKSKEISKNKYAANNIFLEDIISKSEKMSKLKEKIRKIAKTQSTVLITGESGTGKELIARAIHNCSDRAKQPFIAINCGAIPENLLESELFGYVKGAFSGASNEGRVGKFELANNGVIFLDEIGEMPFFLQVKLLRVLQERTIVRIGSNKLINLNIRVIAATNKNLLKLVKEGKFREDLYYRLNVIPLKVPALRERQEDILLLRDYLNTKYSKSLGSSKIVMDDDINEIFLKHSWPGNVRELENSVEFLLNMSDENGNIDEETREDLKRNLKSNSKYDDKILEKKVIEDDEIITLEESEKRLISKALRIYGSDTTGKNICAEKLGIGIATLYRKIEKYKL